MKRICISLFICIIITLSAIGVYLPQDSNKTHTEYLRIHIRAHSNDDDAQAVKYLVKDEVVEYLTPYLSNCTTKQKAVELLQSKLDGICVVADRVLLQNGFSYKSKAKLKTEKFPTRVYGTLTLDSGFYDALIIELGSGKGDNWWCVVYPPLCFIDNGESLVYKSKIYQIIQDFFNDDRRK
jgi:stage II sporulation protein R